MHQRAAVQAPVGRADHRVRGRIEVRPVVVAIHQRRRELPPQPDVQSQLGRHAPVVLHVQSMHLLAKIGHQRIAQVHLVRQPENEVRQVVGGRIRRNRAAGHFVQLRAGGLAELPGVGILPVQRIHVQHFRAHDDQLITHLQRMRVELFREIKLRIEGSRILELRIAGLPSDRRRKSADRSACLDRR